MEPKGPRQPQSENFVESLRRQTEEALARLGNKLANSPNVGSQSPQSELKEIVRRQNAILERVMESATFVGEVVAIFGDQSDPSTDILISCYGRLLTVNPLPGVQLRIGDTLKLAPNTSQIINVTNRFNVGTICTVYRVIDDGLSEVDFGGTKRVVLNGNFGGKLEINDRVILDSSGSIVVSWFGKPKRDKFKTKPEATWDDIVGLEKVKQALRKAIELPFQKDKQFVHYKRGPFKGAFIWGPPGCGKTMLGEAAANALASLHGVEAMESGYFYVKGPEFLDMYVGNSEKAIRNLGEEADAHLDKYHFPAIIFLDECEALLSRRGSGKSADMEKTIVPTFLGVMNKSTAIFILATNKPDVMDPAVIRDGRIKRHLHVTRPARQDGQLILEKNIRKFPLHPEGITAEELARYASEKFYSDKYALLDEPIPLKDGGKIFFTVGHIVNGAMLAGIADRAAEVAEDHDRATGQTTGITKEDLTAAVKENFEEKKSLDHSDELREFFRSIKDQFEPEMLLQKKHP